MEIKQIIVAVVKTNGDDDDNNDKVPLYVKIIIFCFMLLILVMDIPKNIPCTYCPIFVAAFCCVMIILLEWAKKFHLKIATKPK